MTGPLMPLADTPEALLVVLVAPLAPLGIEGIGRDGDGGALPHASLPFTRAGLAITPSPSLRLSFGTLAPAGPLAPPACAFSDTDLLTWRLFPPEAESDWASISTAAPRLCGGGERCGTMYVAADDLARFRGGVAGGRRLSRLSFVLVDFGPVRCDELDLPECDLFEFGDSGGDPGSASVAYGEPGIGGSWMPNVR